MEWALPHLVPLLVAGGFVVGLLVGLTGVGAGSLTTPFLIAIIGVNPVLAVGTDLLFACITKAGSALHHHKLGNVDWPILGWLAAGSLPGAAAVFIAISLTGLDAHALAHAIKAVLAVALVASAVAIAGYPLVARLRHPETVAEEGQARPARRRLTLMLGLAIGSAVALTSVGAGAIGVVALTVLYPALAMRRLVGTDVVHAIPLTLAAGLGHLSFGQVDLWLLATLLAGSVPGILAGTRLTGVLPDSVLRLALAVILCVAAYTLRLK